MTFALEDHWVWDFWIADDGDQFHLFYLHAPKSLGAPHLRHRNARIGHATSPDLIQWNDLGEVLEPGPEGSFDATATWTGSVVRGDDGLWRMFYTGSVFLHPDKHANIESIGVATSHDLHTWVKQPGPIVQAESPWYERLGDSAWPEEAWRDPWVFRDQGGDGWHMLITARSNNGPVDGRGVIGYAWSPDLDTWTVRPPLGHTPNFAHLEVPQLLHTDTVSALVFSAQPNTNGQASRHNNGVWIVEHNGFPRPFPLENATLLAGEPHYAGKVVVDRRGDLQLLAFVNEEDVDSGTFAGAIGNPLPIVRNDSGQLVAAEPSRP